MLRRTGYDVVTAASGEEAFLLLETGDTDVDILVTDVAMTGMNGQSLARRARALLPSLPVLFVSGYPAEVLSGDRMISAGDEVLTKPFSPAELAERIELVRRRVLFARPRSAFRPRECGDEPDSSRFGCVPPPRMSAAAENRA